MCTNYRPSSRDHLLKRQLALPSFEYRPEIYPGYLAPILVVMPQDNDFRSPGGGDGPVEWREAMFGLVPYWSKDTKIARQTYNARSETIHQKPSYRGPWARRRFCLIPASCFYEPNYESGKPVRWRIGRANEQDFAIAGIWETWDARGPDGKKDGNRLYSFSMVTINADQHPLMRRFHAPGDEKRSIVAVPESRWEDWLRCPDEKTARQLLAHLPDEEFAAFEEPAARRGKQAFTRRVASSAAPAQADLLG